MKFGINVNPAKPLVQEIESVGNWGVDFVEIYFEPPLNLPDLLLGKATAIKKTLANDQLFAIGHAPPWCDLGNPDLTTRAAWLIEMKRIIKCSAKLGFTRIDVHANPTISFVSKEVQSIIMDNLISSFAFLTETAKPHGIAIAVENTWEFPSEYEHLLTKVEGLHGTLDIGHAFMRGGMDTLKNFSRIKEVDHLHVHDVKGGSDHFPIGDGKISFKQLAELLRKRNYSNTATIEVFGPKSGVKKSLDKFKEIMR